jgi:uncharacterized protein (TIGR00375 family)
MKIISDLHVHSRFARATSHDLNLVNLEKWARIKGVNLLGTGDFTHPLWMKEIKNELEQENGILKSKTGFPFVLQTEISLMYSQGGKGRRVHLILLAPNLEVAEQINAFLGKRGRLDYDGRPIFGMSCIDAVENLKAISDEIEIIPAHIWTPWFGLLGSKSGFDSFEEAFQDKVNKIYALETGMSSDPAMNWRLSRLDGFSILSFSDLHSYWPWRIGREAAIFDLNELNYKNLIKAIRTREGLQGTIEVNPGYGKYHYDGHRLCKFSCSPEESKKRNNNCPVCGKPLVIGVQNRVEELADREDGFKAKNALPYYSILPLHELISLVLQVSVSTKKVWEIYNSLINKFNNETNILLDVSPEELRKACDEKIVSVILKNRTGKIKVEPGYDGEYGKAVLEEQKTLF